MRVPQAKAFGYTATVVIAAVVIFVVIGAVSGAMITYSIPTVPMPRMR